LLDELRLDYAGSRDDDPEELRMTGSPRAPGDSALGGGSVIVTGLAQRRAWRAHELPPVEQVTQGVWSLPVTIPDNPLRYTLSYLLLADDGAVVVDPGWNTDQGWDDLQRGLEVAGLSADQVTGIVVTHVHPDHHGLSGRLREASGAWIAMHTQEVHFLPARLGEVVGADGFRIWQERSGVPADTEIFGGNPRDLDIFRMCDPDVLLDDGEQLNLPGRKIRVVWTPGHTPGHICLHDDDYGLLLTGDHLLPRISPNIGLSPIDGDSPLSNYLESLRSIRRFDGAEALPAHEYRFRGIAGRADALIEHHAARAQEVLDIVAAADQPTMWEVAQALTWSRPWDQIAGYMRRAALAETAAHIEYLEREGRLIVRRASGQGPDRLLVAPGEHHGATRAQDT
jgi:glyoxylase-like metal-dependent hydrolase (beta-lactamase superfamily II)